MPEKLPQALLIPTLSLWPLTQAMAELPGRHAIDFNVPHVAERKMPERPLLGQKNAASHTIQLQINQEELLKKYPSDKVHVITLMSDEGKQRFILLTQARSDLIKALWKAHGRLKEFDFYSVVDKNGDDTHLIASKRVVTAPANQLTLVFPTEKDTESFFTKENQSMLATANIFMLAASSEELSSQLQLQTTQQMISAQEALNNEETQDLSKEINDINQVISVKAQDNHKSSSIETIELFPSIAMIAVGVVVATPH